MKTTKRSDKDTNMRVHKTTHKLVKRYKKKYNQTTDEYILSAIIAKEGLENKG